MRENLRGPRPAGRTAITDTQVVDQGSIGGERVVTLRVHHIMQTHVDNPPTQFVVDSGEHDVAGECDGHGPSKGVRYVFL